MGFDHVETCIGHTINCKPDMHYRIFLEDQAGVYQQWFPQFHEGYNSLQTGAWDIPEELTNTAWASRISEQ